jgi:uncharacterized protein (DUF488 family)
MTTVYTIGYEGTDIDKMLATLKAVGVDVLADVRAVALSRKKGFSKTALRTRLEAEGIAYAHFVELGDPKAGRGAARAFTVSTIAVQLQQGAYASSRLASLVRNFFAK